MSRSAKQELIDAIAAAVKSTCPKYKVIKNGSAIKMACQLHDGEYKAYLSMSTGGMWCFKCGLWHPLKDVAEMFLVDMSQFDFLVYSKKQMLEDVYEWRNEKGEVVKQRIKTRFVEDNANTHTKKGDKKFDALVEDVPGMLSIAPPGHVQGKNPKMFYRQDEIARVHGKNPAFEIVICEGEKAADAANQLGLFATATGGVHFNIENDYFKFFENATVYIWRDNDPDIEDKNGKVKNDSKEWEKKLASEISKQVITGRVFKVDVEQLGLPEKGDFYDWLQHNPIDELYTLKGSVPVLEMKLVLDDSNSMLPHEKGSFEYPVREHLVDGIIPSCATVFFFSRPKLGKTTAMDEVARCVATGTKFLGKYNTVKRDVVVFSLEDDEESYMGRWKNAALGNYDLDFPKNVRVFFDMKPITEGGIEHLRAYARRHPSVGLYVIDPFALFLGSDPMSSKKSMHDDMMIMRNMLEFCRDSDCSVVLVSHDTKGANDEKNDENTMDRMYGGRGLSAGAHTLISLRKRSKETETSWNVQTRNLGDFGDRTMTMNFSSGRWHYLSDPYIDGHDAHTKTVVDALKSLGGYGTIKEMLEIIDGVTYEALKKRVRKAKQKGAVQFDGSSKYMLIDHVVSNWGNAPIVAQREVFE